jgi:hypothetical protein
MIYRILCEGREHNPFFLDIWEKANEPNVCRRRLMGAYAVGAIGCGTLPRPHIGNRRARFYFTEAWLAQGRPGGPNGRSPARNHDPSDPAKESAPFSGNLSR